MSDAPKRLLASLDASLAMLDRPSGSAQHGGAEPSLVERVSDSKRLEALNFSDLYINLSETDDAPHYRIGPNVQGHTGLAKVPAGYDDDIVYLRNLITKQDRDSDILDVGNIRLRYMRARMADGHERAAIRKIPLGIPKLSGLSMATEALKVLRQWGYSRGIVAIGGATGAGKTTTAVALIHEYLEKLGGKAVTIEDPPEYLLQGWVGARGGHCDQIQIHGDEEWKQAVNIALRWRPRYILFGEIRTPEAAVQALRASTSGHLVIATVHGGSVDESLGALLRLAEVEMGEGARKLLAGNLLGVVHQTLRKEGPHLNVLSIARGGSEEAQIRGHLKDAGATLIASYVKQYPPDGVAAQP